MDMNLASIRGDQVNIVVASVNGHMADNQVRTSSKVARGTPKWR